jgi:hypothetical protein
LTGTQHHAFQALLAAEVQRHAATLRLKELLVHQDEMVKDLGVRIGALFDSLGIRIEELEILEVRPTDASLLRDLSVREEQGVREEAEKVRLEVDRVLKTREDEIAAARKLAAEASLQKLLEARLKREETEFEARIDQIRREAAAKRDAMLEINGAEEQKSQAVRDHELSRLLSEKVTEALGKLPLSDARWVTIGSESPVASLAAMVGGVRQAIAEVQRGR